MEYQEFLAKIIKDGSAAAEKDYKDNPVRLKGALAGFFACQGKFPPQLAELLAASREKTQEARLSRAENYWEIRCFEAEIEWVCNCVSAMLQNEKQPVIIIPTARAVLKAAEVIGVAS